MPKHKVGTRERLLPFLGVEGVLLLDGDPGQLLSLLRQLLVEAALVLAQKLLPPRASIDAPVALAIVGLGIVIVTAPSSVPGLVLPM